MIEIKARVANGWLNLVELSTTLKDEAGARSAAGRFRDEAWSDDDMEALRHWSTRHALGLKRVYDACSRYAPRIARRMRDGGTYNSGRKISTPPNVFLSATINPFAPPFRDRIANMAQKIEAGARFIQTQFCFDVEAFASFMQEVRAQGHHQRATIIAGVGTLSSAKALRRMAQFVPGVSIPEPLLQRIEGAADQREEGKAVLVETIRRLAGIEGVGGVHLMGYRNEDILAQAILESGLRQPRGSAALQA